MMMRGPLTEEQLSQIDTWLESGTSLNQALVRVIVKDLRAARMALRGLGIAKGEEPISHDDDVFSFCGARYNFYKTYREQIHGSDCPWLAARVALPPEDP
jgi:hypothetical protein